MSAVILSTELFAIACPNCGGSYAIAKSFRDEAHQIGNFKKCWFCPYCGERRGYGESLREKEVKELNARLASVQSDRDWQRQQRTAAEQSAEHYRKSRDGMKGVLVKERKRVGNGVCPCCNRHFGNLERHMHSQHPEHASNVNTLK